MGSPAGLMSSRDGVVDGGLGGGAGGEGLVGVGWACKGAAAIGFEEEGAEQTNGSVLMEGGGMACW